MSRLVLTRKPGQTIDAGEVSFTVVKVSGDQVKILIEAPEDVTIHRREITEKIKQQEKSKDDRDGQ